MTRLRGCHCEEPRSGVDAGYHCVAGATIADPARKAPGMTRQAPTFVLFVSLVIIMLGFGMIVPIIPFYVTHFGASGRALGALMAVYSIMQFLFAPVWGRLSDRIGRKPVLLIGVTGFALSFALQGLSQSLAQLFVTRALAGLLSSATLPTALAAIADTRPKPATAPAGWA